MKNVIEQMEEDIRMESTSDYQETKCQSKNYSTPFANDMRILERLKELMGYEEDKDKECCKTIESKSQSTNCSTPFVSDMRVLEKLKELMGYEENEEADKLNCNNLLQLTETSSQNKISDVKTHKKLDISNHDTANVAQSDSIAIQENSKTNVLFSNNNCAGNRKIENIQSCKSFTTNKLNKNVNDNILPKVIFKDRGRKKKRKSYAPPRTPFPRMCLNKNLVIKSVEIVPSSIPMVTHSNGRKLFRFFWLDAYEDSHTDPGTLFLFGKVFNPTLKQYISCCVAVKDIPRRIYFLPRIHDNGEQSPLDDAYVELKEHLIEKNIKEFTCIKVQKNYVFGKRTMPQMNTFFEVRYSAVYSALDSNYSGPAIQAIYGTNVTALELFLIEKNIHGPCWMDVNIFSRIQKIHSWCKIEIHCNGIESITEYRQSKLDIPPITIATLSIQVSLDEEKNSYDIAGIGISCQDNFQLDRKLPEPLFNNNYCLLAQRRSWPQFSRQAFAKKKDPKVILCDTDIDMMEQLLRILQYLDPDFLVGYDVEFEFDMLVRMIFTLGVQDWSRIGKLRRANPPKLNEKIYWNQILCGRPHCDIKTPRNEFQLKIINSDLASIYLAVFNKEISSYDEIKPERCLNYYDSIFKLMELISSIMTKVSHIFTISDELNILSLSIQITRVVGNTLSRTLSCGASDRNEFLLLHEFQNMNYLTPDKRKYKSALDGSKKSAYAGGMILDPKAGYYDTLVLLLDFDSLYPSIIQEFNICFTTIPGAFYANVDDLSNLNSANSQVEQGILPKVLNCLTESRFEIRNMLNSPSLSADLRRRLNSRQLALKLIANSMYGCLGAPYSRFYAKGLASLVTMRGREIFKKTKDLIESHNYEVIYGDTDSFMINVKLTDYEQTFAIGIELQNEINKLFKTINIKIDQVFKYLLLLKKKQYAGLTISRQPNGKLVYDKCVKGLEIIRSDCCHLTSDVGNKVLDELLKDQPSDIRVKNIIEILEAISEKLLKGEIPLSSFEITKTLSKDLDTYTRKKYPHLIVAERLNKINARQLKAGDLISYIICEDNTNRIPYERAYHVKELNTCDNIKVDVHYYLLSRVFPIVLKLCHQIEGIEDTAIAQALGLTDIYNPKQINKVQDCQMPTSLWDIIFNKCIPLKFNCQDCRNEIELKTTFINTKDGLQPTLAMCSNPNCNTPPWKYPHLIQNKLQLAIRKYITQYYTGEIECSNPSCCSSKKYINLNSSGDITNCHDCLNGELYRKYTDLDLYNQFLFFLNIFSLDQTVCKKFNVFTLQEVKNVYTNLKEFMLDHMDCNAYSDINLSTLFYSKMKCDL